jgi:hypothetical protein
MIKQDNSPGGYSRRSQDLTSMEKMPVAKLFLPHFSLIWATRGRLSLLQKTAHHSFLTC